MLFFCIASVVFFVVVLLWLCSFSGIAFVALLLSCCFSGIASLQCFCHVVFLALLLWNCSFAKTCSTPPLIYGSVILHRVSFTFLMCKNLYINNIYIYIFVCTY